MQVVQKIYIECQEMLPDMKIKKGHFWFNGSKYQIVDGYIMDAKTAFFADDNHSTIQDKPKTEEQIPF